MSESEHPVPHASLTRTTSESLQVASSAIARRAIQDLEDLLDGPRLRLPWTFCSRPSCGALCCYDDGTFLILGKDPRSWVHALGHIRLRTLSTEPLLREEQELTIESWAHIQDGRWSDEQEEDFARQWESWVVEHAPWIGAERGEPPAAAIRQVFQELCPHPSTIGIHSDEPAANWAQDLLPELKQRYSKAWPPEVEAVILGQTPDRCYLETRTTSPSPGQRPVQRIEREDLSFIVDGDPPAMVPLFNPSLPFAANVRRFLDEFADEGLRQVLGLF